MLLYDRVSLEFHKLCKYKAIIILGARDAKGFQHWLLRP